MVLYNCECCNYSSKIKCNWIRHLNSKKHFKNTDYSLSSMVKSQKEPQKSHKRAKKSHKRAKKSHKRAKKSHLFCAIIAMLNL